MGNAHESERRWAGIGEVVLCVVFYFWAVWIFNAFLPPKPEQTPFEAYLKNQMWEQDSGGDSLESAASVDQRHHSLQARRQE